MQKIAGYLITFISFSFFMPNLGIPIALSKLSDKNKDIFLINDMHDSYEAYYGLSIEQDGRVFIKEGKDFVVSDLTEKQVYEFCKKKGMTEFNGAYILPIEKTLLDAFEELNNIAKSNIDFLLEYNPDNPKQDNSKLPLKNTFISCPGLINSIQKLKKFNFISVDTLRFDILIWTIFPQFAYYGYMLPNEELPEEAFDVNQIPIDKLVLRDNYEQFIKKIENLLNNDLVLIKSKIEKLKNSHYKKVLTSYVNEFIKQITFFYETYLKPFKALSINELESFIITQLKDKNFRKFYRDNLFIKLADFEMLTNALCSENKTCILYAGTTHCNNLQKILSTFGFEKKADVKSEKYKDLIYDPKIQFNNGYICPLDISKSELLALFENPILKAKL